MATVIIVGGPAGTGKTTIAELLAQEFKCPFVEGDSLHPQENVDKMAKGQPLTDDDRWGWLRTLSEYSAQKALESPSKVAIASCSMLKKVYREYIAENRDASFKFVFLHTTYEQLLERVGNRQGHFMKLDMVRSQYDIMEIPCGKELVENGGSSLDVNTQDRSPDDILQAILPTLVSLV